MYKSLGRSNIFNLERVHNSNMESKFKKNKPDEESSKEQLSSSSSSLVLSSDIENKVMEIVQNNLGDLTKLVNKVYTMQKRTSDTNKVQYFINHLHMVSLFNIVPSDKTIKSRSNRKRIFDSLNGLIGRL